MGGGHDWQVSGKAKKNKVLSLTAVSHRFDFLLGFMDALVVKNVAEDIPTFLRLFFLTDWSWHGRATPAAFTAAISSTFAREGMVSTHPLIYAIQKRFFRYAASVANRAPWSLPPPHCSSCGPGSQVLTHKFSPHNNPGIATYRCKACNRRVVMKKPEGIKQGSGAMWVVEWDSYLKWVKDAAESRWTISLMALDECKTTNEYLSRYIPNAHALAPCALGSIAPNLSRERYEYWMGRLEIPRGHWDPLIRLVKARSTQKHGL